MRRPTLRQAICGTLKTWRGILHEAKAGNWQKAQDLLNMAADLCQQRFGASCLFCVRYEDRPCARCEVMKVCNLYDTIGEIDLHLITPQVGLRRIRRVVRFLEELKEQVK